MFCFVSAGHERENRKFLSAALVEPINTFDGLRKLCSNNKLTFVASGMGIRKSMGPVGFEPTTKGL